MVLLRIFSEQGQRKTFELAVERVGKSKVVEKLKVVGPIELAMAEGKAKGLEHDLSKSKAEGNVEDSAHHQLEATRELAHPHGQTLKEEAVVDFDASTDVSDGP